ncbi:hypothetical protein PR048_011507 [Dryococelus australis]|uniref:Uncharacterized protein n=1 Tax=Dryococelus australis TaxID=614101 RepID=A0ABQ9HMA6_9NEOP|nr:hypothetical protein PR048_011507 [Dryococelus australis]
MIALVHEKGYMSFTITYRFLITRNIYATDGLCGDVGVPSKLDEPTVSPRCRECMEAYVNYSDDSNCHPDFQPGSSSDSTFECSSNVSTPCPKKKKHCKKRCNSENKTDTRERTNSNSIKPTECAEVDQHITEMLQEAGNLASISEQCEDCADTLDMQSCSIKCLCQHRGKKKHIFKSTRPKKEKRKIKRNKGEEYVMAKGKTIFPRRMKPLNQCRMKCNERMTEDQRKTIFGCYWGLGNSEKRVTFTASLLQICSKKASRPITKDADKSHHRQITIKYHLIMDGTDISVCKGCFVKTLVETNKFVEMVVNNKCADVESKGSEIK